MKLFLASLGLTAAEIALSSEDIEKFKCRKNAWQLPQVYEDFNLILLFFII